MSLGERITAITNNALIDELKVRESLRVKEVEAVMRKVDRAHYVAAGTQAYVDRPQPIGYNATISAPHMHAMALEMLLPALKGGARRRALDVGAGSGYLTVCMALLQGEQGLVVGVEHIPELMAFAEDNIRRDKPELLEGGRVRLVVGDGRLGYPSEAPFDAIHVGAAASQLPTDLEDQLAPGGRMVVPVGPLGFQQLMMVERLTDGKLRREERDWVAFVPLTDAAKQWTHQGPPPARRASVVAEAAAAETLAVQTGVLPPSARPSVAEATAAGLAPSADTTHSTRPSFSDAFGPRIRKTSIGAMRQGQSTAGQEGAPQTSVPKTDDTRTPRTSDAKEDGTRTPRTSFQSPGARKLGSERRNSKK